MKDTWYNFLIVMLVCIICKWFFGFESVVIVLLSIIYYKKCLIK